MIMMATLIPFIIAAAVIALDQVSKHIILANMQIGESFNLIKYILNITFTTNTGASFGILKDHRWIFMSLSTVALILMTSAILYFMQKKFKGGNMFIASALALMLGGGFGNMIDRVARGYVVDFLEFAFVNFAIFNIADTFICIGSALFCICIFAGKYALFDAADTDNDNDDTDDTDAADKPENINNMENTEN